MKWIAISGAWRTVNDEVIADVEAAITDIIQDGNGIVSGGALGVDYIATRKAIELDPQAERIKIILPTPLEIYATHFCNRANEGIITHSRAEKLIEQLTYLQQVNPQSLIEMNHNVCTPETYHDRNTQVIESADGLVAFHVNASKGTADAIEKARLMGMEVLVREYIIEKDLGFTYPK